jgi:hypothetical protein
MSFINGCPQCTYFRGCFNLRCAWQYFSRIALRLGYALAIGTTDFRLRTRHFFL